MHQLGLLPAFTGSPFIVTVAIEVLLVDALVRLVRVQSEDAHGKVDELW